MISVCWKTQRETCLWVRSSLFISWSSCPKSIPHGRRLRVVHTRAIYRLREHFCTSESRISNRFPKGTSAQDSSENILAALFLWFSLTISTMLLALKAQYLQSEWSELEMHSRRCGQCRRGPLSSESGHGAGRRFGRLRPLRHQP